MASLADADDLMDTLGTTSVLEITLYRAGLVVLWILARAVKPHLHEKSGRIGDSTLDNCTYSMKRSETCAMMWKDVTHIGVKSLTLCFQGRNWPGNLFASIAGCTSLTSRQLAFAATKSCTYFCDRQRMLLFHCIWFFYQFCQSSSPRVWCWSKHISDIIRYISSWHLNVLWSKVTSEPSGGSHWVSIGLATSFSTDLRLVRSTTILDNIGTVCDII